MKSIVFANFKGGVGKTTTCFNIGALIANKKRDVLLVDCDPQGNLTKSFLNGDSGPGLYEAITEGKINLRKINDHLFLLGGDFRLSMLEKQLTGELDCYVRLKELLEGEEFSDLDYVFVDTPPSAGILTINAMTACENLVVPLRPSLYSMQGTNDLLGVIRRVRKNLNPKLNIIGVLINDFDARPVITRKIVEEIQESFKDKVFSSCLSRSIRVEEAIAFGKGLAEVSQFNGVKVKTEIEAIGAELLSRLGG